MPFKNVIEVVYGKHDIANPKFSSMRGYAFGTDLELSVGDNVRIPMNNNSVIGTVRSLTSNYAGPVREIKERAVTTQTQETFTPKVGQIVKVTGRCHSRLKNKRAQIVEIKDFWTQIVFDDGGVMVQTGCKLVQLVLDEDQTPIIPEEPKIENSI
jgi:hypothetical protein